MRRRAGRHAPTAEGATLDVHAVVLLLARLQLVDQLHQLRLHGQRLCRSSVALNVQVGGHLTRLRVEEERRRVHLLAILHALLGPDARTRARDFRGKCQFCERVHKRAEFKGLGHGRQDVARRVRLFADEHPRILVGARRKVWAGIVDKKLSGVAHAPSLDIRNFDALAGRHKRRQHRRSFRSRGRLFLCALQLVVLVVGNHDQAPLEVTVQAIAGKRQPLGAQVPLELRLELYVFAVAAEHNAAAQQLTVQDTARSRNGGAGCVELLERLHLLAVQAKFARPAAPRKSLVRAHAKRSAFAPPRRGTSPTAAHRKRVHCRT